MDAPLRCNFSKDARAKFAARVKGEKVEISKIKTKKTWGYYGIKHVSYLKDERD